MQLSDLQKAHPSPSIRVAHSIHHTLRLHDRVHLLFAGPILPDKKQPGARDNTTRMGRPDFTVAILHAPWRFIPHIHYQLDHHVRLYLLREGCESDQLFGYLRRLCRILGPFYLLGSGNGSL